MKVIHTAYSYENAKKITDALETLNRNYQLEREVQTIEYAESKDWGHIPKPQRVTYTIKEA